LADFNNFWQEALLDANASTRGGVLRKNICDGFGTTLNGKNHRIFRFLLGHFVAMAINHGFITQKDGKHYHGSYNMLHYVFGCIATAQ